MQIHADLHAHSAFAGGARGGGKSSHDTQERVLKRFKDTARYSPLKGVNLLGTGDCQFDPWLSFLKENLVETAYGIFRYKDHSQDAPKYVLQTELIITGPIPHSKKRKRVHIVILLPSFDAIEQLNLLMDQWGVARKNMARPFIVCSSPGEISERLHAILDIDPYVEIIPAHVLTPEGVYGGNLRINTMKQFFGDVSERFHAIETGLSADPDILGLIPELDKYTLISNADAHSSALNRIGREFTTFDLDKLDYHHLIDAIRSGKVSRTCEFHPTEGRYFLTGHRADRKKPGIHLKNQYCYFSPQYVPTNDRCPQCHKELTVGVLQRALEVMEFQGERRQVGDGPSRNFVTMVPLVEIVAHTLNMKSLVSNKVLNLYTKAISICESEADLWTDDNILSRFKDSDLPQSLIDAVLNIRGGNFHFSPLGYDGQYGQLQIGSRIDFSEIIIVNN